MQHGAAEEIYIMRFIIKLSLASGKVFNIFGPFLVPLMLVGWLLEVVPGFNSPARAIGLWTMSFLISCIALVMGSVASYGNYKRHRAGETDDQ